MPLEVAIIGAGISGINTAFRLQEAFPDADYEIFEGRAAIGGTWDLFKYPGLRSDSDLFSFGFEWRPWVSDQAIAEAPAILAYLKESLRSFGGDARLRLHHKLVSLDWSSEDQLWRLDFEVNGDAKRVTARWVVIGTGYYDYEKPLDATIPGLDKYDGQIVHPQFWPKELDLNGKKVAIIGSGATAITILPNIVDQAEHVTLLQRSPSYIATIPKVDRMATWLKRFLPLSWATRILRVKYLVLSFLFFNYCRRFPNSARSALAKNTKKMLPRDVPLDPHFTPRYNPWDQRLCMSPDGDFYAALRSGKASIVTGEIEGMSEKTIIVKDQPESSIEADVVVTATGLRLLVGGHAKFFLDGQVLSPNEKMLWKGCMLQDVPNLVAIIGYTNASWTLGADVAAKTLTRLFGELRRTGATSATPTVAPNTPVKPQPFMQMQSTYLLKGRGSMPLAGDRYPWLPRANYFSDYWAASYGPISDDMRIKGAR